MNRIVMIVTDGVADYVADDEVKVMYIDTDNLNAGDILTKEDIKGFEDLVPSWIQQTYIEE
jgi:2,3-bisphosphoglycerate-independent phosphoglycerate mutase